LLKAKVIQAPSQLNPDSRSWIRTAAKKILSQNSGLKHIKI